LAGVPISTVEVTRRRSRRSARRCFITRSASEVHTDAARRSPFPRPLDHPRLGERIRHHVHDMDLRAGVAGQGQGHVELRATSR
jgi:hypothetical protein